MTSTFGMLPLVLSQGAGNELYMGLGSVVIGGILASSLFTVVVIPSLLSLVLSMKYPAASSGVLNPTDFASSFK
jgi:HAE1 family hydrophobic/amphiphilic exporter-1